MKLLVTGYARHGKDTVAEFLRDDWGLSFQSSSMFCAERVMMPYFESIGRPYASVDECYADRVNHRAAWHEQIVAYNDDPTRLTRELFDAGHDIYVGMRSDREYEATKDLFDHTIWVCALGRGLPVEPSGSMKLSYVPGEMILINNAGTLEELRKSVGRTFAVLQ